MKGVMAPCRRRNLVLAVLSLVALSNAGPLGPLPNATSSDAGLREGSCVLGDVVYMEGDKFVGATPCEQCACAAGSVRCATQRCEPRPGCKALHRPDHCCPTYQCECEQEGRVYGNGEKLVDPSDPCRVCYCQGGEVVCRRIACFLRDDCQPRLVKGRCCPEYDNCPLRGVTAIPGLTPSVSSISSVEEVVSSAAPTPKENKQKITIKEITPVSEIPVITEVKIKEILPSPSIEVPEYPSSKSPLIPREAIPEKSFSNSAEVFTKTEEPVVIDLVSPLLPSEAPKPNEASPETKTADLFPSKISLSTQDSINSDIYPSYVPTIIAMMGVPALTPDNAPVVSTARVTMIEEEDTSLFDHNPAFPPIPDDLSVVGTHEDENVPEVNVDGDQMTSVHEHATSTPQPTVTYAPKETPSATEKSIETTTTEIPKLVTEELITTTIITPVHSEATSTSTTTTQGVVAKNSPMLDLRTAIPTEILDVPPSVKEDITGELDDPAESVTTFEEPLYISTSSTTEYPLKLEDATTSTTTTTTTTTTTASQISSESKINPIQREGIDDIITTISQSELPKHLTTKGLEELTTLPASKSNIATEITSRTEFSSLPIETSDQNPHDSSENVPREKSSTTTETPLIMETSTAKLTTEPELVTVSTAAPTTPETQSFENVETTEFVLTSFGSESTTDSVELIKISSTESNKNAAFIDASNGKKTNILTDLKNIVGDVASISDHTEAPEVALRTTTSSSFSLDSEEMISVNAGYKSKNNNFNLNSITETPLKSKNQVPVNKQWVVEIEDEDFENITDAPPPNDKVEPTTRRAIIDTVSDDVPRNETSSKKDIEIIQSYVPTINRNRPTKVIMKKSDKPSVETSTEELRPATEAELGTEGPEWSAEAAAATAGPLEQ